MPRYRVDTGVTFGSLHSFTDLGLILRDEDFGFPGLQRAMVSVPGLDGDIDLMNMIDSRPHYGNRIARWEFALVHPYQRNWYSVVTRILNELHGKTVSIVSDNEREFTLYGCVEIKDFQKFRAPGKIVIEADCRPYRSIYADNLSGDWKWDPFSFVDGQTFCRNWTGEEAGVLYTGELKNLGTRSMPMTITTTEDVTYTLNGESWNLAAGGRNSSHYIDPGTTALTYNFQNTAGTLSATYGMEKL